ncbi:unnamed protein product, partial [Callosobruchus maculatus]
MVFHQSKTLVYMSMLMKKRLVLLLIVIYRFVPCRQLDQGRTTELSHHSSLPYHRRVWRRFSREKRFSF